MTSKRTENERARHRTAWRSLDQLSQFWGLSRARTDMVVRSLVRTGRMEERPARASQPFRRQFRMIGHRE
jgi:hypothetical protein